MYSARSPASLGCALTAAPASGATTQFGNNAREMFNLLGPSVPRISPDLPERGALNLRAAFNIPLNHLPTALQAIATTSQVHPECHAEGAGCAGREIFYFKIISRDCFPPSLPLKKKKKSSGMRKVILLLP